MIKFAYTIFYVKDVNRSIHFYEQAFGFQRRFIAENSEYGELNTGETTLSFASVAFGKTNLAEGFLESDARSKPFGMEIGVTTQEVQAVFEKAVEAGAIPVQEAKVKPWGQTVAYVRDPDGFLVEICTPVQ